LSYGQFNIAISGYGLFVVNRSGTIGEYTTTGATVNASLISGLSSPFGIAALGNKLFVANEGNGVICEYTTSGQVVNASLVGGLDFPYNIAISPVPEPTAFALAGLGVAALCLWRNLK
jgi:hypothetical protein